MRFLLLICIITCATFSFSQNRKLKKADQYFNKLSYVAAIPIYEGLLGTKMDSPRMEANLALSYYQIGDMKKAVEYFQLAFSKGTDLSSEHMFYFAQALKQTGNYSESDKWMANFSQKNSTDLRAKSFNESPSYLTKINEKEAHVTAQIANFNSIYSDFGGYNFSKQQQLIFLSARKGTLTRNTWSWNGQNYLNFFSVNSQTNKVSIAGNIKKLNSDYHEGPLCFNNDESLVYFTRNNLAHGKTKRDTNGIQNLKIIIAEITKDGSFTNFRELAINSRYYSVGHPTISPDGKLLYFVSDMPGGFGGTDIYKAAILADGNIGIPENLGAKVNTNGNESFPFVSANNQLYFASNGHIGLGGLDIFVADISTEGIVSAIQHGGKLLNSNRDDFGFVLNKELKSGYFSSNRDGGVGSDDIYQFQITKPFVFKTIINGVVADKNNGKPVPFALVKIYDENNNLIASTTADKDGNYTIVLQPSSQNNYKMTITSNGYESKQTSFSASANLAAFNVELEKPQLVGVSCIIKDIKTNKPIEGVQIVIKDKKSNKTLATSTTDNSGNMKTALDQLKVGDVVTIEIVVSKPGYLSKTITKEVTFTQSGFVDVSQIVNLNLAKLAIGLDLASVIDIKPIYFDYGRYDIRKDAAIELDKIVALMNEYPTLVIELGSHTDCRGPIAANMKLSNNRAIASANYIKSKIKNPNRINGKGYGESKLKNGCACEGTVKSTCTEEEHQENRRTEFIIIKM
jgi:outer membrane protein OmpA-like peptidoglycan-associated protein